jgi:hypothetical protein
MALTYSNIDATLKQWYHGQRVEDLINKNHPTLALLDKDEGMCGRNTPIPVKGGWGAGRSAGFAQTQTNAANGGFDAKAFLLTHSNDFATDTISGEAIDMSSKDPGAFLKGLTTATDGCIAKLSAAVSRDLFATGYGELGTVATGGASGSTITASNARQVKGIEKGDIIVFAATLTGALRNSGTGLQVSGVDRNTGIVTFTAAVSGESVAAGDYFFHKGDRGTGATPTIIKNVGFPGWCPSSAPAASESFFGVDRSTNSYYAGLRYAPGQSATYDEILMEAATRVFDVSGEPVTHFICSPTTYLNISKVLAGKVQIVNYQKSQALGFQMLEVMSVGGTARIVADSDCPDTLLLGLNLPSWTLYSNGKLVRITDLDGNKMLRQATSDGYEIRALTRYGLGCNHPSANINVTLPS